MSIGVLHGQTGGAGLAVKVVGGSQRPETGKQGLIWVNTDQKITSWTMQVEEPTEPTEGMVWVFITTGTKLNALKKNGIWFTPTSARQYSDGGWVKKTGEYYNNDQWFALFEATINITYPAGSTCKATDGTTTLTAPDTSGAWACVVPNAGTWTITITNNAGEKSKSVSITTDGETESCIFGAPPEYQEVEYIQTTGTQYINTNIVPSDNTYQVSTKIYPTSSENYTIFGTKESQYYHLTVYNGKLYYGTNGTEEYAGTANFVIGSEYSIEFNNASHGITINGDSIATGKTFEDSSNSIKVGLRDTGANYYAKMKCYYFRIINNETNDVLMDLVPCYRRSDSVAGMYDLVGRKFIANAGTGTFLVGEDVL